MIGIVALVGISEFFVRPFWMRWSKGREKQPEATDRPFSCNRWINLLPDKRLPAVGIVPAVIDCHLLMIFRSHKIFGIAEINLFNDAPIRNHSNMVVGNTLGCPDRSQFSAIRFPFFAHTEHFQYPGFIGIGDTQRFGFRSAGWQESLFFSQWSDQFYCLPCGLTSLKCKRHRLFDGHNLLARLPIHLQHLFLTHRALPYR